jgi:hypothetical protein
MRSDAPEPAFSPELIEELFSTASGLDTEQRCAFLAERCAGLTGLQRQIEDLLRAGDRAASETLWKSPGLIQEARRTAKDSFLPFDRLAPNHVISRAGPYRLVRRLGQGGQGAVFEGVRDDGSFRQRVAKSP